MKAWIAIANVFGCATLQLGLARLFISLPGNIFAADTRPFRELRSEVAFYRHILRIRTWKKKLPDGASWVGGKFSKQRMHSLNAAYLRHFVIETRRGESAHWVAILCAPVFYLWNPAWACWVITLYLMASNLPCIVAQRYNRFAIEKIISYRLQRREP